MSFITSVAGPSRLPYTAIPLARAVIARANSTEAAPTPSPDPIQEQDARAASVQAKQLWSSEEGYKAWKEVNAKQYQSVTKGRRAQWLGGSVVSFPFRGLGLHCVSKREVRGLGTGDRCMISFRARIVEDYGAVDRSEV